MSIFDPKLIDERKAQEYIKKHNLHQIHSADDKKIISSIISSFPSSNLHRKGLGMPQLDTIIEQNWLMIRQNDKIASLLEKLNDKPPN